MPKSGSCEPAGRSRRVYFGGEAEPAKVASAPKLLDPFETADLDVGPAQPSESSLARSSELSQPSSQAAQPAGLDQLQWLTRPISEPGRAELQPGQRS